MDFAGCEVVELRRYRLRPGMFDDLQAVFQPWLVDGQEAAGMRLGGQFRDRDRADRFVWFRGFASMQQRHEALTAFYTGPLWRRHAAAANATMIDSDDVLLLRATEPEHRPAAPGPYGINDFVVGEAWTVPAGSDLERVLSGPGHRVLERALGQPVAMWRTEPEINTFKSLPVREGSYVVWLAAFPDEDRWRTAAARLTADPAWREIAERAATVETMCLEPTATSKHPAPRLPPGTGPDGSPRA
ncbi:NIPSNAP family protein [Paractinoplanes rishiriensis]|uniref:NIPSNAP family containing protein n=1 Tax=Paractinoplanes rishiriensis TaxID=1050105 RepID=A0A919K362_9ACTN|nr:NIPSNAP family protein [Actinoplanes rishiriensis]GIE99900.1 NIPSNAP family containing protein [Actinoplanes rishiriensis]